MLHLQLITPEKIVTELDADSVTLHTEDGEITVLPGHINVFTKLRAGQLLIRSGNQVEYLAVHGGFADITSNQIKILADTAVHAQEIDELKAQEAKAEAERALANSESTQHLIQAQASLRRALLEIETLVKWRRIRTH